MRADVFVGVAFLGCLIGCGDDPVPAPLTAGEIAKQNFRKYVQAEHSTESWDLAQYCTVEEMPPGEAECNAREKATVGGVETYIRTYVFSCSTKPNDECHPGSAANEAYKARKAAQPAT